MTNILSSSRHQISGISLPTVEAFYNRNGEAHLLFACHAALPLGLTPELLYNLWRNFKVDGDNRKLEILWLATPDLLLSNLCEEVGAGLYEMNQQVRTELLTFLEQDRRFGLARIKELAAFLTVYVRPQLQSENLDVRDFAQAQYWVSMAYLCPERAAKELLTVLVNTLQQKKDDLLRIASIVGELEKPLNEYPDLLTYARGIKKYAQGNNNAAQKEFDRIRSLQSLDEFIENSVPLPQGIRQYVQIEQTQRQIQLPWIYRWTIPLTVGIATSGVFGWLQLQSMALTELKQPTTSEESSGVLEPSRARVQLQRALPNHSGSINDLLIFANGLRMVSAGADKTIRIWDLTSGETLQTWNDQTSYVNTMLLSPDETRLYSGNADGTLQAWTVASGDLLWQETTAHNGPINTVDRTPDGQWLVSGGADGAIHIWEANTGNPVRSLPSGQGAINSLVVTSDGQYIISGGSDRTIKFWHIATGKLEDTLEGHESFVNALAISPDGRFLFSASADGTIRQWQVATGKLIDVLSGHTSYVNDIVFSRDGRTLSTGSADQTIRTWNVETGAQEKVLNGFNALIDHVEVSSTGQIVTASRTTPVIKVWQIDE